MEYYFIFLSLRQNCNIVCCQINSVKIQLVKMYTFFLLFSFTYCLIILRTLNHVIWLTFLSNVTSYICSWRHNIQAGKWWIPVVRRAFGNISISWGLAQKPLLFRFLVVCLWSKVGLILFSDPQYCRTLEDIQSFQIFRAKCYIL